MRYTVEVRENGVRLDKHGIEDPFINTTIRPKGWRSAWKVVRGKYQVSVHVDADRPAPSGGHFIPGSWAENIHAQAEPMETPWLPDPLQGVTLSARDEHKGPPAAPTKDAWERATHQPRGDE